MLNKRIILGWFWAVFVIVKGGRAKAIRKAFAKDTVTCIYMHNPDKKLFEKTIKWLIKREFIFISSSQLHKILKGDTPCPKGAIHLSIDDCWRDNLTNIQPLQTELGLPITYFPSVVPIKEGMYFLSKIRLFSKLIPEHLLRSEAFKKISNAERKTYENKINASLDGNDFPRSIMTQEELLELSKCKNVEIGSHTMSHPFLTTCDMNELQEEIGYSKQVLEEWIDKKITTFSYPIGDFDERVTSLVSESDYLLAFTTIKGHTFMDSNVFELPRFSGMNRCSFLENSCHVVGCWKPIFKLNKSL